MGFFTSSAPSKTLLAAPPAAPSRKKSQRFARPRDDVDEFLSSDLELSFASTMSLHSPHHAPIDLTPDYERSDLMDISPLPPTNPVFTRAPPIDESSSRRKSRPRAFTSAAREFGHDVSNTRTPTLQPPPIPISQSGGSASQPKRIARSALPFEWLATAPSPEVGQETTQFLFTEPQEAISAQDMEDAMDVDTIIPSSYSRVNPLLASPPISAAPTITQFNNLFYESMSPRRSSADSPAGPSPKKRRSLSPESVCSPRRHEFDESSPPPSSPMARKHERISSGSFLPAISQASKPSLLGLGPPPANPNKRSRRPALSAMIQPSDANHIKSGYLGVGEGQDSQPRGLVPPRRAFSAMLVPAHAPDLSVSGDESSMDYPDMSSPAQAYSKRQQGKTLRRIDGTDNFRPLTGASPTVRRDVQESPSAKFLSAGMPGFGDNEAHGKILPCHRVREDGLMRIKPQTIDKLLDGVFDSQIAQYHIIDCRFDYEYNGGHIPGATNINTPSGVEDFLLGSAINKPKQTLSGDPAKKTILIFHCEFSVKRAPTFAKHLRSKDRAMNNHVYPRIHYPEVYILEGGYCQYFKECAGRCKPSAYVTMDDPNHALSRKEDLDQFRKAKFGRTKSYAYGEGPTKMNMMSQQQLKRNTAPSGGSGQLFAVADKRNSVPSGGPGQLFSADRDATHTRRGGPLTSLPEDHNTTILSEDDDTDIGDSPCPPPTRNCGLKGKTLTRVPFARAETLGPARMAY